MFDGYFLVGYGACWKEEKTIKTCKPSYLPSSLISLQISICKAIIISLVFIMPRLTIFAFCKSDFWRWWVFFSKCERMGRMCQTPGRLVLFCPANAPVRVKILELLKWKHKACRDVTQLSASLSASSLKLHTSSCWRWLFKNFVFVRVDSTEINCPYTKWQKFGKHLWK